MCTGCSSKFVIVNFQNLLGHPVYEKERKLKMQSNEAPLLCFLLSCISTFLVGGKLAKGKRTKEEAAARLFGKATQKREESKFVVAKYCKIKQNVGCISNAYTTTNFTVKYQTSLLPLQFLLKKTTTREQQRQKNALKSF